ncbi:MAG: serine/threonine protein kinase [Sandaracinus sp.]|nr:serine/threonine protein kinase [Sandaracinus sp.]MCB9634878.1 serine/threonine protein kinase [Sandaracinus sp.]
MSRASSSPSPRRSVDDDEAPSSRMLRRIAADDPLIGRVLDQRYRIETVLGAGGVGVVYRAEHTGLRRPVALKVLRHGFEENPHLRRRFEREARVLSQLSHPNVVALTDYGIADGLPFLVMELLEGRTLEDLLEEEGPPAPRVALDIVRAVVRGLAFAHDRGVLHRDLKPGNVFLQSLPDDPHHVKLLDFGLAKLLVDEETTSGEEPTLTKAGTIVGTPAYMSPEQASGGRVDPRSDVYSAGLMLFELLSGRVPFDEPRRADLLRAHLVEPVPDPEGLRPGLTLAPPLRELLLRCLAKEASDRYADGSALVAALDALPDDAARFAPPTQRDRPTSRRSLAEAHGGTRAPKRRRSPWLGAAIVMGLAGLGGVGWVVLERLTEPTEVAHAEPGSDSTDSDATDSDATDSDATSTTSPTRPATSVAAEDDDSGATDAVDAVATGLPEDRDPFETALPPELAELSRSLDAAPGDREVHRAMRVYQRLHPDDPRPSLLLARDFAKRGAWSQAFERYELALRRHPSARHDPQLLEDVLSAAQVEAQARAARDFVVRVFGVDARPRVRELLAQSEHRPTRVLLRALDTALGPEG